MARLLEIPIKADLIKKSTNTYSINADSTGVYFKIDILKNGEKFDLTDKTVRAYMLKKDKKVIYIDCTLENKNDELECFLDVTTQMLNAEYLTVQFLITDTEGSTVVSNPVYIAIGDTVIDTEAIESSNEFSALQEALLKVNNLSSNASPLMANTVADMTDSTRCYVYTGTEEGYSKGYLYYWNGTAWTKGWLYQSEKANAVDVTMADGTDLESTVGSLKEDLVNSKKAENITMADGTTIEYNLCNKKDITSSIFIKEVTGIVLYYNKISKQIDITRSAIASYSCYNVGDKNKLYLTFSTFDRTDKTTAIEYVFFTDDNENVQKATVIGRAFSDEDDKTAKQYINAEIIVPENAKRMYITYVVAEGKPIIRTIDKLDLQKSVNDGENSKKYLKELYASNSAKGMQELDNKLEIYVSNYIAENGKKINGVNKTRAEIKEWILNRDNCIYHGALHKEGTRIVDKNGYPVEIRGIGTHQLLQFTNIQTKKGIETLQYYGVNCLRLTAYLEDAVRVNSNGEMSYGYLNHVEETRARMDELIEWCVELGLYVIVDWNLLATDGLMSGHIDEAKAFFEYFASKYKNCDNVIYEICNEPFGNDETLDTYMPCVKECYNIIRHYNAHAILVHGMH